MADDLILKAIQGGGGAAVADEEEDPILSAIRAPESAASNLRTPTLDELATGQYSETKTPSLTERAAKVGKSKLPLKPPTPFIDATKIPLNPLTNRYYDPSQIPQTVEEQQVAEMARKATETELLQKFNPAEIGDAARQQIIDKLSTGSRKMPIPAFTAPDPGNPFPGGVRLSNVGELTDLANENLNRPDIPKTRTEAFFAGTTADTVKTLNDMFLSPIGLAASALGLSETVAIAKAGQFGGDAVKLAQEYEAMRAAGASGAELAAVEAKMKQSILAAAKAQKAAVAGKIAGQAAAGAFGAQGVGNVVEGVKDKDVSKVLEGLGQAALGGAAAVGAVRAGGAEKQVQAETAARAARAADGEVSAKRTTQVPERPQQPTQPAQLPPVPAPVGGGETTVPEKPETLNAQVNALKKGTNKVVYFPRGTDNLPEPPPNATVTVVKGYRRGAGTYYHTDDITPAQIKKAVANGTYGQLLGNVQTKEEAAQGQPATVVARDEKGTEQKASVVDVSKPEAVQAQAQKLADQFPGASIGVETPEKVVEERRSKIPTGSPSASSAVPELNARDWWHVPPVEGEGAYTKRGKFLASSFKDAEFYGRPLDEAQHVSVKNPLIGTEGIVAEGLGVPPQTEDMTLEEIAAHDQRWANAAKERGYDSIVTMSPKDWEKYQRTHKLPRTLEINDLSMVGKGTEKSPETGLSPQTQGIQTFPNASAESPASLEAIKRLRSEKTNGDQRLRIDTRTGNETPLIGPEAVDAKAGPYDRIVLRKANGAETVLDEGAKATAPKVRTTSAQGEDSAVGVYDLGEIGPVPDTHDLAQKVASIEIRQGRGEQIPAEEIQGLHTLMDKIEASHGEPVRESAANQPSPAKGETVPAAAAAKPASTKATTHAEPASAEGAPAVSAETAKPAESVKKKSEESQAEREAARPAVDHILEAIRGESKPLESAKGLTQGSKIESEKESANGEATESLGEGSERPPAEVPAENARGAETERGVGELSEQRGGAGEGRVHGERELGNERTGSAERGEEEQPVPAERGRSTEPGRESRSQSRPGQPGNDYRITDADRIGQGTISEKFAANVDAIRTLKDLEASGRPATPEEQSKLVRYSGWGWSGNLLNEYHDRWRNERKQLQTLLTDEEYRAAVASTKNAHYTSPEVIKAVWQAIQRLGFAGGRILEPSAGVGHFFGLMPNDLFVNSRRTAIELDTTSGKILKQLYQTADTRIQGFEALRGLDNFYDLAVSNVPFGDYSVHDPAYNKYKLTIHNYFIAKMLDKVRPGGLVAAITSHHTLDNYKSAIRQVFLDRGDLVGAIRLPANAFKENAGTDVTTDLLLFRKRGPEEKPDSEPFLALKPVNAVNKRGATEQTEINEYFHKHPEMALGEHSLTGSMYGYGNNYELRAGEEPIEKLLPQAIELLPKGVMKDAPIPASITRAATAESIPDWGETKPFGYLVRDGKVYQSLDGQTVHLSEFPKANIRPLADMLGIRNATRELFQAESKGRPAKELTEARGLLNRLYDAFVKKNGYLNQPRNLRIIAEDPDMPLLSALEKWDPKARTAAKADVFFKQTVAPRKEVTQVERPEDSLPASLAEKGRIDFDYMSKLTGLTPEHLQNALREEGSIFRTPVGHWETKDEYLSGDVRRKLRDAEEAAKVEPEFKKNVEALKAVQPRDLEAGEISVRVGTPWIPEEDVAKFIDSVILDNQSHRYRTRVSHVASEGIWKINNAQAKYNDAARTKWGTSRMHPIEIFEDALNLRRPTVYDQIEDAQGNKRSVVNEKETLAAREKHEQIEEEFRNWLFKDADRAQRLVSHYNENYNNLVDRDYDGSHLTFPGMNAGITLRPNQKDGIWRSLVGGNTLLAHVVGAGKTFTIIASAMESKRLGLAKKPMVVVPNHLVEQWASDFQKLYPQARVLAATKEEWGTANRKKLMSRIATGDWDAVIVPHSSFTLLPVSDETYKKYAQRQLDMIEEHLREMRETEGKRGRTVKELEKAKARIEARMKKALNRERKDNTINFEDTGVDRLYVDEAHAYKNLFFSSKMGNINGIPKSDAQRSFDMYLKSKYIGELNNGSGVTFATGTPISNTTAEIYTMMRYMNEGLLEQNGISHFDSWAAAYGQTMQNMEVSPEDPTKFRISTRFAKFNNVAELKRQFRQNADVILAEDLEGIVKVPDVMGGKPTVIEVPATDRVRQYIGELGERAKAIRKKEVRPEEDNMLKITSEGRKIALDYRSMFPAAADDGESKITVAARKIAEIYHATRAGKSTQAVMLDLMTPSDSGKKRGQFNAYADLKNKLVGLGVPANEVAFIHDAKSDEAKQALFDRVNSGEVAVILGSSDKMGVGTNIQERLLALHHIDVPWRPSDIEQRNGRMIRQGNTNPTVQEYRYVTSGTFDSYMWSGNARKANFIHEMMQHGYDVREMEDVDGASLSYAEAAAIATGDARVLEKVKVDADVDRLQKLKSVHEQNKLSNQVKLGQIPQRIQGLENGLEAVRADIKTRDKNAPDEFRLSAGKQTYTERKDAGAALNAAVERNQGGERLKVGKFNGFDIVADGSGNLHLEGQSTYYFGVNHENPLGTIQSMEKTLSGMETREQTRKQDIEMLKKDLAARQAEIDKPFHKQAELDKALDKQKELNAALAVNAEDKTMAGARADQEFNEDFKAVEPSKVAPAEDTDEEETKPSLPRRINPRHPEAGFITGETLLAPWIALGKLVRRVFGAKAAAQSGGAKGPEKPPTGPPKPAESPSAQPGERAGNIRLDKLNAPEDVLNEIRRAAKENAGEFNGQRRGKIPFYKTKSAAQQLVEEGTFTEKDLEKMQKGTALNAEELLAARGMLIASAEKVREAAKKLRENDNVENVLAFQEALMRHSGIQKAVSGAVAEAGRALSQQRIIANALKSKDKTAHERMLDALGGQELSEEAAARLARIPEDDPVAAIKFLRSQKEWTTAQKIEAYWIANVLSSPRTPIKKVLGDVVLGTVEGGRRFVDVPVDKIMAAIQGRKSETTLREAAVAPLAYVSAIPEGIRKAAYILSHGFDPTDPLALEMPHKYEFPGGIKNPFNIPGRALSAATKFFQVLAFQGELHAQAVRQAAKEGLRGDALKNRAAELIQNPTEWMIDAAMKAAEFQTYTERPDALSRILMSARDKVQLPKGIPLVGGLHPMRFIIPFVQIPYNLTKQAFRYSPFGAARLNDFNHAKSPEATKTISRALIGTAIMGLFAYLAAKKLLTGAPPNDPAGRDEFYRSGKQPYSIKIGNRWVSYKPAGPFALTAAAVAAWHDRHEKKETMPAADEVATLASSMGKALLDESFLRGLKNVMDALNEPDRFAGRWASGTLGGFVPMESALRTVGDSLDPTVRNPQTMYDRIVAGLPVVNKSIAPKLDALGRPSTKEGSTGLAALFPGGFAPDQPKGDIDAELDRLNKLGLKNVGFAGKHLTMEGYKVTLAQDEQDRYQKLRGIYLQSYLRQTFNAPEYKQMNDEDKIQSAEDAIHEAERDARGAIGDQILAERLKKVRSAAIPRRPPAAAMAARP